MLRPVLFLISIFSITESVSDKEYLTTLACKKNPKLAFCIQREVRKADEADPELIIPPPMPKDLKQVRRKDVISETDEAFKEHAEQQRKIPNDLKALQLKCARQEIQNCQPKKMTEEHKPRCTAYFRDCAPFIPKADPLAAVGNAFSSNVGINLATIDVKGIPYYPVNEEGAVGVGVGLNAPFGSWGGGYSDHVGVRDYWNQHQEVGANWVEGKYGYKNGWSVPLVQSLGVEGGQHNTVSVPLTGRNAGTVMVDNGYNVGGYYGHNDHVGVDPRHGDVQHTFGVGSPFVNAGFMTGQAVAFPGLDVWERALGK